MAVDEPNGSATISGVGLILNTSQEATLASCYTELSGGSETATPAINIAPGGLEVGKHSVGCRNR